MNRRFKISLILWTICFVLFNAAAFILLMGRSQSFWVGYGAVVLAFAGQLFCSYKALKSSDKNDLFYGSLPLAVSGICLAAVLVVGIVVMLLPFDVLAAVFICLAALAISAAAVLAAFVGGSSAAAKDKKQKTSVYTFKNLTAQAEHLIAEAKTDEMKKYAKEVYEAFRFSDPVSNQSLVEINERIQRQFAAFSSAVKDGDEQMSKAEAESLIVMIDERNKLCRANK